MTSEPHSHEALEACLERIEQALAELGEADDGLVRNYVAMVRAETTCLRYHALMPVDHRSDRVS